MVFSSLIFLIYFLPIVLVVYYAAPGKIKNLVLFLASLFFYAWGEPVYVILMLFSTIVDYTHGILVDKFIRKEERTRAKLVVASSVAINLLVLGFFKYYPFLINTINTVFNISLPVHNLGLPIGISFYTFQTMSYTIDVYRQDAKVQKNIISFGTYVALFPQLIAGPIVQYKTIDDQLRERKVTLDGLSYGIRRFIIGLGKKVLLANNIGLLWENVQNVFEHTGSISLISAWLGAIAFTFQIYFDFSGYSDMAIGLGAMLGFRFNENFNYPYQSASVTEFWRRWHISLGTWFREYVYIPLGGNRVSTVKWIRNILVVWALTGIWHGASWNFGVWGLYFGILLILEKLFIRNIMAKLPRIISMLYTFVLVTVSWVIFSFEAIKDGLIYIKNMFVNPVLYDAQARYILSGYLLLLIISFIGCTDIPKKCVIKVMNLLGIENGNGNIFWALVSNAFMAAVLILSIAYIVDATYNPFLYFRF